MIPFRQMANEASMTRKSPNKTKKFSLRQWLRRNPHAYWTLAVLVILVAYVLPEQIVVDHYWPTQTALDQLIPFVPAFVIFYLLWFPCLFGVGFWLLFKDGEGYQRYICFLLVAYLVAAAVYLCWPNGQDLRPTLDQPQGIFEKILSLLYSIDTNTNVLPSLHVVGAIGFTAAVLDTKTIRRRWIKVATCILAALISASTVFVKQHALLDVAAGVILGTGLYIFVFFVFRRRHVKT